MFVLEYITFGIYLINEYTDMIELSVRLDDFNFN